MHTDSSEMEKQMAESEENKDFATSDIDDSSLVEIADLDDM